LNKKRKHFASAFSNEELCFFENEPVERREHYFLIDRLRARIFSKSGLRLCNMRTLSSMARGISMVNPLPVPPKVVVAV